MKRRQAALYTGTSLMRNSPSPWGHHRAVGIVLLQGPRGALFLMSEAPMYLVPHSLQQSFRRDETEKERNRMREIETERDKEREREGEGGEGEDRTRLD